MRFLFLSGYAHLALEPAPKRSSGGAELQVALLARELSRRGHAVTVLGAEAGQPDGVTWQNVRIRTGARFDTGALMDCIRALPRIVKVLSQERPDYVVVYGWTAWLYVLCHLRRALRFRLVFVCALDAEIDGGFRRENPFRGLLFERAMRMSDARLGITDHQARLFRAKGMSCSVTRLLLQDSGTRTPPVKEVDLLWVARCHPVKRPHLFLDLAERLPWASCRMICSVQDEGLWRGVKSRAEGIPNVDFIEAVPYRDIQQHFDGAKIFVNTSESEGVPNTFIHSGLGRTAILSLVVNPDRMFETFDAGYWAAGDFEAFWRAAAAFLSDAEKLRRAQSESARFVREWHGNELNVAAFLNVLQS